MIRTFVDANVLIAAARGNDEIGIRAVSVLDDPEREFFSSVFVKLEVCPKAIFNHNDEESGFYEDFFASVTRWSSEYEPLVTRAMEEAQRHGLAALDALHVAAAALLGADEFVTAERPSKPLCRVTSVRVVSIHR